MDMRSHLWVILFLLFTLVSEVSLWGRSILNFPYLSFDPERITGLAIVNPNDTDAAILFAAFNSDGTLIEAEGLENPVSVTVGANSQYAITVKALFAGEVGAETVAWCQAISEADDLTGFFLALDSGVTFLDGADLPESSAGIRFNEVRLSDGYSTELKLINPNEESARVQLELEGGGDPTVKQVELASQSMLQFEVGEFFGVGTVEEDSAPVRYVIASSESEILGFESIRAQGDLIGLNARPADELMGALYFPQFAVLGGIETTLTVVNGGSSATILTISAYDPDGKLYGASDIKTNPVTRALKAGEALREDLAAMFGFEGESIKDGWLKVISTSETINGTLSYLVSSVQSRAAVASSPQGASRSVFSHIATTLGFFTGVAILNSGSLTANVKVAAFTPDGDEIGSFSTALRPGQRVSKLLTELIPESANQAGGLIWLKSDLPVFSTSLFGSSTGVLSNIPPQPVPLEYEPDQGEVVVQIDPALAIVKPKGKQVFTLEGVVAPAEWSVNGVPGGSEGVGFINDQGAYSAPAEVPSELPITVTATVERSLAGASVDVLNPQALLSGLGQVQSVAFLEGLQKLFTAELATSEGLGSAEPSSDPAETEDSTIFDVTSTVPVPTASYPGEKIAKMIPFDAVDGREYLLLAGQTTGRIIRLDPENGESIDLVTGLDQPSALVIDSSDGSLLIAEEDQVSSVSSSDLNQGLSPARPSTPAETPRPGKIFDNAGGRVAVNLCNGNVFVSLPRKGEILEFVRATGALRLVASGLEEPRQILGFYRRGISCPASFHLLVVERGIDQITLVVPADGTVKRWLSATAVSDIILLPRDNPFGGISGVLFSDSSGQLSFVKMPSLYLPQSVNPVRRVPLNPCRLEQISFTEKGENSTPAVGRNGTRLAFISSADPFGRNSDGDTELFVVDITSGEVRQATETSGGGVVAPTLNADGSLIAFVSDGNPIGGEAPAPGIYLLKVGKGIVDYFPAMPLHRPSMDAGGTRLVFDSEEDLTGGNSDGSSEVFLYELEARRLSQVTTSDQFDSQYPSISGNGRLIVFRATANLAGEKPDGAIAIFTYEIETDNYDLVAIESRSSAGLSTRPPILVSGDASRIAFFSDQDLTGGNPAGAKVVYLYDLMSRSFTQISKPKARPIQLGQLSWEGSVLSFASSGNPAGTNRDGNWEVFLFNLGEWSVTQVSRSRRSVNLSPSLSGDGVRVAFSSNTDYTARNEDRNNEIFLSVCKPQ